MKKTLLVCLTEIILLVIVFLSFRPVLRLFNIYGEQDAEEYSVIHVRMLDEPDRRSYGNEMRILYVKVNGEKLDLSKYDTEDWVWHGEWGYTLFTSGDHDFYINIDHKIEKLDFCYIKQEGSGKCEIYLNDHLEKVQDMYSSKWKNGNLFISFLSARQMFFRGLEIWILLSLLIFLGYRAFKLWNSGAEDEFKLGIGTFNLAKGLGICFVVMIHVGLCVLTEADLISGSLMLGVLFVFLTYGLMPAFFILGGFGRKTKRASAGILTNLKEMMIPYLIISLVIIICNAIKIYIDGSYEFIDFKKDLLSLAVMLIHDKDINGEFFRSIGPLWFTSSFALGNILLSAVFKIKTTAIRYIYLLILITAAGYLMSKDYAYFCITTGFMAAVYMYVGYLIYKDKRFLYNVKIHAVLVGLLPIVTLLALLNGTSFAISGNNMGNVFVLGFLISTLAALIYIRVCVSLNDSFLGKIKVFGLIGRYSYHIFFAHALEYMVIPWNRVAEYLPDNVVLKICMILVMRTAVISLLTFVFIKFSKVKNNKHFDMSQAKDNKQN